MVSAYFRVSVQGQCAVCKQNASACPQHVFRSRQGFIAPYGCIADFAAAPVQPDAAALHGAVVTNFPAGNTKFRALGIAARHAHRVVIAGYAVQRLVPRNAPALHGKFASSVPHQHPAAKSFGNIIHNIAAG